MQNKICAREDCKNIIIGEVNRKYCDKKCSTIAWRAKNCVKGGKVPQRDNYISRNYGRDYESDREACEGSGFF